MIVQAYKEFYKNKKNITNPNVVVPRTAHPAFDKGCDYFGISVSFNRCFVLLLPLDFQNPISYSFHIFLPLPLSSIENTVMNSRLSAIHIINTILVLFG